MGLTSVRNDVFFRSPAWFPVPGTNTSQPCLQWNMCDRSLKVILLLQSRAWGTRRQRNAAGGCGCCGHSTDPMQLRGMRTLAANSSCDCSPCCQQGCSAQSCHLLCCLQRMPLLSAVYPGCPESQACKMVSGAQLK